MTHCHRPQLRQVREYVQGFKNFKGTGGARSRVMNAVEYLPNPESWEHISIPQDMDTLLDALTVNLHEVRTALCSTAQTPPS